MSALKPRYYPLRVSAVIDETADTKSLVFEIPADLAPVFRYRPGQFLTLRLALGERHVLRCYSMSSAPSLDAAPRVTIKRVAGGLVSNWICDHVKPGDVLDVLPPAGVFTPRALDGDFLLFAGGSGVTPVFSILRTVLANGAARVSLFYANRNEHSIVFERELAAIARDYPQRFSITHWLDAQHGVPTVAQLADHAQAWQAWQTAQAFICGPSAFMDATVDALHGIGMAHEQVHVERFVSLPDEEALTTSDASASTSDAPLEEASIEVLLDGATHVVPCKSNETLLEAAVRAGLQPPFSCQAGMCASCMCQVTAGAVHLRHNDVLDKNDLAAGWTLSCQAVPVSPHVRIRYPG
jgi:3-ketosteroid 9alpha-monooxygenase subunit B